MKTDSGIIYKLTFSKRKTVGISVLSDGSVSVCAPYYASVSEINRIVDSHRDGILKNIKKAAEYREKSENTEKLSGEEIKALADKAVKYIPERVKYYAPLAGVDYGRITIRNQKTRWGSCSQKGNLNFNCLLMLCPAEVIDSVVVHELCHRKHMDHSKDFYNEVYRVFPEYDRWNRWLKENGQFIMSRMTEG